MARSRSRVKLAWNSVGTKLCREGGVSSLRADGMTTPVRLGLTIGCVARSPPGNLPSVPPGKMHPMLPDTPSVSQLSQVISQAAAPAFLLGAIAAFIAILISRLNRIIDRTIVLNGISDESLSKHRLRADLPRLLRRTTMLNRAIFWSVMASIAISTLVIVAFASDFFRVQHEHGVALLFVLALAAFTASLIDFAREVRIALSELDHFA
jgi:Protein of unknown function (DUF2721)